MKLSQMPIPPKSEVRLVHATKKTPLWLNKIGTVYRIGYYGRKDGLDCIWLVDELGAYVETLDHATLLKHFAIIYISKENDLYGKNRGKLRALRRLRSGSNCDLLCRPDKDNDENGRNSK